MFNSDLWLKAQFPIAIRTLILTAIAVPLVVYAILPVYHKWFDKWLNNGK